MEQGTGCTRHTASRRAVVAGSLALAGALRERRPVRAADRTAVTVWTWQEHDAVSALSDAASAFNAAQSEVSVEVVRRPAAYPTFQVVNAIRDGLGPDLCVGGRGLLAERDALGLCQDLAPLLPTVDPAFDLDRDSLPFAAQEVRIGDRIVGIPLETSVRVLAVNRSLLAASGVDLAEWDPAHGPVTFDRLAGIAQGLDRRDASGAYQHLGFVPAFGEGSPYQYLCAWGASSWDDGHCAFTIDTPEFRGAVEWVRAYQHHLDGSALATFLSRYGGVTVPAGTPFLKGAIAFALARNEDLRVIASLDPGFELGATFVPVPAAGAPSRSWATGNAISLMTGARHPEAAFRFMAYLTSAEVLDRYCRAMGSLPSRKVVSAVTVSALALPSFIPDRVLPAAVPSPHIPIATQFQDLLFGAWSDMTSGTVEVASGLAGLQADADWALADSPGCA